ncbi:hypothetical protein ALC53_06539 [Atta colombica]|uniref:Uncharacterized protein n=1 Tax=Atta colombica TaxID=520822 RepID=A0A195BEH3_9HYME|nr:hypothetical protein ALC53_06539 [Atta colombica]
MVIKFGENVSDRSDNLTKKTELKSADSEHHLVEDTKSCIDDWIASKDEAFF